MMHLKRMKKEELISENKRLLRDLNHEKDINSELREKILSLENEIHTLKNGLMAAVKLSNEPVSLSDLMASRNVHSRGADRGYPPRKLTTERKKAPRYRGWSKYNVNGYWQLKRTVNGRPVVIYIGKDFDTQKADERISEAEVKYDISN